jgi:hypothetical protein
MTSWVGNHLGQPVSSPFPALAPWGGVELGLE